MPHQCTDCGRAFDDGSTEMLSGCPDCGGNTFQFRPDGADEAEESDAEPPEPPERPGEGSVAQKVGSAATTVRDLVGSSPSGPPEPTASSPDADVSSGDGAVGPAEDAAQASARSELVSPDELPATSDRPRPSRTEVSMDGPTPQSQSAAEPTPREDRPDLSELRAELNDQFESIKVLEPGQYELNLMSLYDREEYIIALQEDGKYTIQVPERWEDED